MGWGGEAWAVGGEGGKVAMPLASPPPRRRTHSFPWDEHKGLIGVRWASLAVEWGGLEQ